MGAARVSRRLCWGATCVVFVALGAVRVGSAQAPPLVELTPVAVHARATSTTRFAMAAEAIRLVNVERTKRGLVPFTADGLLTAAARRHSLDQATRDTMSHTGSDGTDAGDRISQAGYRWNNWGENVASGYSTAAEVVAAWMSSTGHRANILSTATADIGIAFASSTSGTIYWTMDTARHA